MEIEREKKREKKKQIREFRGGKKETAKEEGETAKEKLSRETPVLSLSLLRLIVPSICSLNRRQYVQVSPPYL